MLPASIQATELGVKIVSPFAPVPCPIANFEPPGRVMTPGPIEFFDGL